MLHQSVTTQFQALLAPLPGSFSAFARATYSLSVSNQYLELEVDAPCFMPYTRTALLFGLAPLYFDYETVTLYGAVFQPLCLVKRVFPTPHLPYIAAWDSGRSVRLSIAFTCRIPIGLFSSPY